MDMDIGLIVKDFLDYNFKPVYQTIGDLRIRTYYTDWRSWKDYKETLSLSYASIFEYDIVEIFLVIDYKRNEVYLMIVNNDPFSLEEALEHEIYLRSFYNNQGYTLSAAEGIRLYKEIENRVQKIKVIEVK